ncbi:uncharacterized mitochondrial protein AtMg00810-like [Malus domestica]|uniref:uncharacterized mitochondrial protein AtMg00810-like n=1 Tax=Malus domestica TaxID=3750 RepID=UPI003975008C
MDVKNAFLYEDLQEEVYMQLPPGSSQANDGMVCRLHKAIYRLKQYPRAWYAKLSYMLEATSFIRSNIDSPLFIRKGLDGLLVVLIYVDDIIITGENEIEIEALKQSLNHIFAIKDLGRLKYFLYIEMATSQKGLFINQRKYVMDLLIEAELLNCKLAAIPLDSKLKLDIDGEFINNLSHYQRLVGKLIYLTITQLDITYVMSLVSQFMHAPSVKHLLIAKRILSYLKGSIARGILMKNNHFTQINGYMDSDWAGNLIDRKSTTGYFTFVGGNLVTWKSKKTASYCTEAEYCAMTLTTSELICLKGLLSDLGLFSITSMSMMCDNQAAMHIVVNPVFHERTK